MRRNKHRKDKKGSIGGSESKVCGNSHIVCSHVKGKVLFLRTITEIEHPK
jgi:hypothetical protein